MALREEMREEMTSGEAGLTVTWFGERFEAGVEGASAKERLRRCLGTRRDVRGGIIEGGVVLAAMLGADWDLVMQVRDLDEAISMQQERHKLTALDQHSAKDGSSLGAVGAAAEEISPGVALPLLLCDQRGCRSSIPSKYTLVDHFWREKG